MGFTSALCHNVTDLFMLYNAWGGGGGGGINEDDSYGKVRIIMVEIMIT